MTAMARMLSALTRSLIGIAVMVVVSTIVFYIAMFVVSTGARLAGYAPSGDFVVVSAALLVVAVILTGGLTPQLSNVAMESEVSTDNHDDAMYD